MDRLAENNSEASLKQRGIQPEFYPDKFRYDEIDRYVYDVQQTKR